MDILISGSYNTFNEGYNGAGVYAISGLIPSSNLAYPLYIGGTNDLRRRLISEHLNYLNRGIHENPPLQYYTNKYGIGNLVCFSLETTKAEECFNREQYYLDALRPFADEFNGFNINHYAIRPPSRKNAKMTEQAKYKIAVANLGKIVKPETKEKLSKANLGKKYSKERIEKASRRKKTYLLLNPSGEEILISNLAKHCRENSLNNSSLRRVYNGCSKSYKGWKKP